MLVTCFLAGVSIYLWRDRVPLHPWLFVSSTVLALALMSRPETTYFAAFPAAYTTVFLGLTSPSKNWFLMSGDYSYSLYLFAFPVQQTYACLFPSALTWWADASFAAAGGLCYAVFSWHVVEKQILQRKRQIIRLALTAFAH
jgi:peptidoglycan/LPS O-acetylase OafA/YrhL